MFDTIEPFADYSFNKSHSVGYGYLAYQTAYLKANHPVEYLAALLTSVKTNKDQTAVFLNECRQLGHRRARPRRQRVGVRLLGARTGSTTRRDPGAIRFGMSAVRNVGRGRGRADRGARARRAARSPTSTTSASASTRTALNKRTIESLIKAGGFDSLGHPRQGLVHVFEQIVDTRARPSAQARPRVSSTSSPTVGECRRRGGGGRSASRSPTPSSRRRSGSRSRRRCSAST